jgi:transposase
MFLLTVVLSIEERVFLVEYVFREGNRYTDLVQEQFAEKFPQTPVPYRNAVRRLTDKFRETGSVLDAERSGKPCKINDKKLMDISDSMLRSPSKSLRKLAQGKYVGLTTAHKAVREKFQPFPYKVTEVQELKPADQGNESNTSYKCTATVRTHCIFLYATIRLWHTGSLRL